MIRGENRQPHELIGLQLGTCVLERPLGVGGMGTVYLAQQLRPRRQVAVKVLQRNAAMDTQAWETFLTRFRREADAAAALDHANIVPIYEFGEDGDIAYLVMPYLADGSLAELLEREVTLPVRHAVAYVEQAAAALDHAHAHGIVHRDVKPSNLLLHPDGRLLLADFGIARAVDGSDLTVPANSRLAPNGDGSLTQHGVVMGTPEFMAPEQIRRGPISPATDVYALSIVAYNMLVGQTPFVDEAPAAVLARQLREPPTPIRTLRPDVPASVEEAVFWALAKEPEDRPASAGELAQAMRGTSRTQGMRTLIGWHVAARQQTGGIGATQISQRLPAARSDVHAPYIAPDTDATITDGRYFAEDAAAGPSRSMAGAPVWPGMSRAHAAPTRQIPLIAFLTAGGLVALVLIFILASAVTGDLLAISNQGTPAANGALAHGTATPLPTATPKPKPSPTPRIVITNWLAVSRDAITLGCKGGNRTQTFTLTNNGPQEVQWQAQLQGGFGGFGISVTPNDGRLDAGDSVRISVTNNRSFNFASSGTITFQPDDSDAGDPPSVRYSMQNCH